MKKSQNRYFIYPVCIGLALLIVFGRLFAVQIVGHKRTVVAKSSAHTKTLRSEALAGLRKLKGTLSRYRVIS